MFTDSPRNQSLAPLFNCQKKQQLLVLYRMVKKKDILRRRYLRRFWKLQQSIALDMSLNIDFFLSRSSLRIFYAETGAEAIHYVGNINMYVWNEQQRRKNIFM